MKYLRILLDSVYSLVGRRKTKNKGLGNECHCSHLKKIKCKDLSKWLNFMLGSTA